jgi:hypothetical protein
LVSPALQRGEKGLPNFITESHRDGARHYEGTNRALLAETGTDEGLVPIIDLRPRNYTLHLGQLLHLRYNMR